ncbi:MAG: PqqD family protein [Actinomycetes bacterium]
MRIRSSGVTWREVDGEIVALNLESSSYFATNATGARLWAPLVAGCERAALIDLLVATYGIATSTAASDVDRFLGSLRSNGLLDD